MDQKRAPLPSRLFAHSLLDVKDEGEDRYERCYTGLGQLVAGKGEKEINDALNIAVSKDAKSHEDICIGLMVVILTEPDNAPKHYRYLTFVARDGMHCILNELNRLVLEKYLKLKDDVRKQLLWFTREMIKNQVQNVDGLCWNLMRQIGGGDLSQKNLWLADTMMDIYMENRAWLEKYQFLLASVVYTYLRIIEDHAHANLSLLRTKEVNFVVSIIRDRFCDALIIGRDLVRLLQNIARIPEIEQLWQDILYNPTALAPTFTGLVQIMHSRTSRRFLQSRITPDMEKKLVFLTSQVRFGSHKRYQEWFQRTYLSTLESQSLRCDLIRFIVGVIHPTNELLCSDIIPRWAVIGWLLTTCTNPVAASNAKLALFYDWLFFDAEKDNIMNIEPAILVMHHSMRPHPAITATLLDFLCRIINNFWPAEADKVRAGIYSSLRQIVDKKVLPSLSPLFDNIRLDRELRAMLKERFGVFLSREEEEEERRLEDQDQAGGPTFSSDEDEDEEEVAEEDRDIIPILQTQEDKREDGVGRLAPVSSSLPPAPDGLTTTNTTAAAAPPPGGSWQAALATAATLPPAVQPPQLPAAAVAPPPAPLAEPLVHPAPTERRVSHNHVNSNGDGSEELNSLILEKLDQLREETNGERRCEAMDQLVHLIISEQLEGDEARQVAEKLSDILRDQFEGKIFPENPTPESIEDSVGQPLFVIFRTLCEINEIDPGRHPVLSVLAELYGLQPRLGYYLLYYLKSYNNLDAKSKSLIYKDLCEAIDDNNSLDICLVNDMRQCQEDDVNLFVYLVPDVYTNFQKAAIGNVDLLYLVVSCVDGRQIQTLVCHIIAKDFIMFKKDSFQPVISVSLTWETFEQYALWQLLLGHELPVDCILPLIPKLSFEDNAEALTHIMLLLRREKPSAELIKHLMSREPNPKDRFVTSVLSCWLGQQYEEAKKLGDLIGSQLCKQASPAGLKRKRTINLNKSANSLGALAEMTLGHLDLLRQTCKNYDLFNMRSIQQSLQTVRSMCTDSQKKKFSDLFALADSESEEDSAQQKVRSTTTTSSSTSSSSSSKVGGGTTSSTTAGSSSSSRPAKSPHKLPKKTATTSSAANLRNSESSGDSSESEEEGGATSLVKSNATAKGRGSGGGAAKPRKRGVISKVSYKELGSSEASSDDEDVKKTPKKKKRVSSDSE